MEFLFIIQHQLKLLSSLTNYSYVLRLLCACVIFCQVRRHLRLYSQLIESVSLEQKSESRATGSMAPTDALPGTHQNVRKKVGDVRLDICPAESLIGHWMEIQLAMLIKITLFQ